jgi:hypothetical protein
LSSTMQSLVVALVMLWKRDIRRNSSEVSLISVIFTASLYGGIVQKMMATATTNHSHNSFISHRYLFYYLSFFSDTMALISSAVPLLIAMVVILKGLLQSLPSCTEVPEYS